VKNMKLMYYPGCSLKTIGSRYEKAARTLLKRFNYYLEELERWNCCGVVYNLATDTFVYLVGPTRNLIRAQEFSRKVDSDELVVLCSMCFNVLKMTEKRLKDDPESYERITKFMDDEEPYEFGVKISHILEIIRDKITFEKIKAEKKRDLSKLNAAAFYGCIILRPPISAIDDREDPQMIENIIIAAGARPVDYPFRNECCGSYIIVKEPEVALKKSLEIVLSAKRNGARIIVTTCPLCAYNLEEAQKYGIKELGGEEIPVFYVPELLCYALGFDEGLEPQILEKFEKILGESNGR